MINIASKHRYWFNRGRIHHTVIKIKTFNARPASTARRGKGGRSGTPSTLKRSRLTEKERRRSSCNERVDTYLNVLLTFFEREKEKGRNTRENTLGDWCDSWHVALRSPRHFELFIRKPSSKPPW